MQAFTLEFGTFAHINVEEHQHRTIVFGLLCLVRPNPHQQPTARADLKHFSLKRAVGLNHLAHDLLEIGLLESMANLLDRPADVARVQPERGFGLWCEFPHAQVRANRKNSEFDARLEVQVIAVELSQLRVASGQFFIDRAHLLVRGFEFLFGSLEFFVQALQFLVAGLRLFVAGLQFLVCDLGLLLHDLKIASGFAQFTHQVFNFTLAVLRLKRRVGRLSKCFISLDPSRRQTRRGDRYRKLKQHQQPVRLRQRRNLEVDHLGVSIVAKRNALCPNRAALFFGAFDQSTQRQHQAFSHHSEQVETRLAAGRLEEPAGRATKLHNLERIVDHHTGRAVTGEQQTVHLALRIFGRARGIGML